MSPGCIYKSLKKFNRFLITTHTNPEGDGLGSQLALAGLLKEMGKKVYLVNEDAVPQNCLFLPGAGGITTDLTRKFDFDAAVIVDASSIDRIGNVAQLLKGKFIFNIDHHTGNRMFGNLNWVDTNASAAGEMIYELLEASGKKISKSQAIACYVAILTDTGCFCYENTTVRTHLIAARLLKSGLQPEKIAENIYETRSFSSLKLLCDALSTMRQSRDKSVAWISITRKMLKATNSTLEETDGFINYPRSLKGVKVAVIFKELDSGKKIRVSFRSKGGVRVYKLARSMGGGGHKAASGCVIHATLPDAQKLVLNKIRESLKSGRHTHHR